MRDTRNNNSYERDHDRETSPVNELTKKEQAYRHNWQDKFLRSNTLTFRLGQIFGLVYHLAVLYLVYSLVQSGDRDLALKVLALNVALVAFAILVTAVERKILSRKPARKSRDKNFKPRGKPDRK